MSRILIYSDFKPGVSELVDQCFIDQIAGTKSKIAYIPSESDRTRKYFKRMQTRFEEIGVTNLFYFDLGEEFDSRSKAELFDCDAIYLSGGDPLKFIANIRFRNFTADLKQLLTLNKLIVGVSAGAMVLAKSLELVKLEENQKRPSSKPVMGIGILPFEFYPHFRPTPDLVAALTRYAKSKNVEVLATDDDAGIFIENGIISDLGAVYKFPASN